MFRKIIFVLAMSSCLHSIVQAQPFSATRKELPGVRNAATELARTSDATYAIGMSLDGNKTFVETARTSDVAQISAIIRPEIGQKDQIADIFVVVMASQKSLWMLNQDGAFVSWDGQIPHLVPYKKKQVLAAELPITILSGTLGFAGNFNFFLGYLPADGILRYTSTGHLLHVTQPPLDLGALTVSSKYDVMQKPRHPLDLQNKEIRLRPQPDGAYGLGVDTLSDTEDMGTELVAGKTSSGFLSAFKKNLPFNFPFAGKIWNDVYINSYGNLTFGKPEYETYVLRDPWPDAGLRSVAASINLLSTDGKDKMISVLWDFYKSSRIFWKETPNEVLITWVARKNGWFKQITEQGWIDDSIVNVFQARLHSDGQIDLLYPDVKTDIGIVGIFNGSTGAEPKLVEEIVDQIHEGTEASIKVRALRLFDEGTQLKFQFEMKDIVAQTETEGSRSYRVFLDNSLTQCKEIGLNIGISIVTGSCETAPKIVRYALDGRFVNIWVSKEKLVNESDFKFSGDVVWWGGPVGAYSQIRFNDPLVVHVSKVSPLTLDLSQGDSKVFKGNFYEVFHETVISRNGLDILPHVVASREIPGDIALAFTEFALDEFSGQTPSTGALNIPIKGIGTYLANPFSTASIGFSYLQVTTDPVPLTNALYLENGVDSSNYVWKNYSAAVRLYEHEIMHRWGIDLSFIHPVTKQKIALTDSLGHWVDGLDSRSLYKVFSEFSQVHYVEHSIMGGAIWTENSDGTFTPASQPYNAPAGLSGLDLYVMGLIPPADVPDTFYIENLQSLGGNKFSGTKVPVTIASIMAASGVRVPAFDSSQKEFKLRGYLIYDGAAATAWAKERTENILREIRRAFSIGSGGEMIVK